MTEIRATSPDDPIEILELSTRTFNCLKRDRIGTVGQLVSRMSSGDPLAIRNLSRTGVREIRYALLDRGYKFDIPEQQQYISGRIVSISLEDEEYALLSSIAKEEFRTLEGQIRFMLLKGLRHD